jgi:hypothetical protein
LGISICFITHMGQLRVIPPEENSGLARGVP